MTRSAIVFGQASFPLRFTPFTPFTPGNLQAVLTKSADRLATAGQPVAVHFYGTKLGYVQSDELIGNYSWQTNAPPNPYG